MDFTNKLFEQLRIFWGNLGGRQRATMVGAVALLLSGLLGLVFWANQVHYVPLFTNMSTDQLAPIVESLKQQKEVYRIGPDGTSVDVPEERVLELRMALASDGLVTDGVVGFELFDSQGLGVTNFVEHLNYQRALQGELVRTINQLDMVEGSRVHLVLPKDSLFVSQERPASASVVLKIRSDAKLGQAKIQGIVSLVSASIEGLTPENVSIVDTEGRVLHATQNDSTTAVPSTLLEHQESLERRLEERVQAFLEKVVGTGKVIAKVQADIETRSIETTAEVFNPDGRVLRSEQTRDELRNKAALGAKGVPGTTSNLPENVGAAVADPANTSVSKKESTANYEIDRTISKTFQAPGQLKRLSVAVLVDGTYKEGAVGADGEVVRLEYVPRTQEEMTLFEKMVKSAVGYSEERQDEVSVANLPFQRVGQEVIPETEVIPWEKPSRYAMVLIGMILVFLLIRPLLKSVAEEIKPSVEEPEGAENLLGAGYEGTALGEGGESVRLLEAGSADKQRREEMINLARSDMENTVQTVRDWLRVSE